MHFKHMLLILQTPMRFRMLCPILPALMSLEGPLVEVLTKCNGFAIVEECKDLLSDTLAT